jgi:hypothetical protein
LAHLNLAKQRHDLLRAKPLLRHDPSSCPSSFFHIAWSKKASQVSLQEAATGYRRKPYRLMRAGLPRPHNGFIASKKFYIYSRNARGTARCRACFMREGFAVPKGKNGIFRDINDPETKVADFSYQNDSLAALIVHAWEDDAYRDSLTTGTMATRKANAKKELGDLGIYLENPIVITEDEYVPGFQLPDADGVVFVLPNKGRATLPGPLLETAKLLMAITPNGI